MARIRSIKPEFWTSEQVMECSALSRLLFIGMWNFADDLGRLALSPKTIKAQVFPSDDVDTTNVRRMIDELSSNDLVLIYEVGGKEYLQITGWQHQKIDRPQPGKCPAPANGYKPKQNQYVDSNSSNDRRTFDDGEEGKGEERKGKEHTPPVAEATRGANEKFEEFWKERPRRDGDDPRKPAEKKFNALVKTGVDPDVIISGAKLATVAAKERGIYGTKFVPQTVKWLNDQRFVDYAAEAYTAAQTPAEEGDAFWDAVLTSFKRFGTWSREAGPNLESPDCRAPAAMLAKHGLLPTQTPQFEAPRLKSMGDLH